jgi:glucosamine kinase
MKAVQPQCGALYLGIDGGGSKCRARLVDDENTLLGVGTAGPANPFQNLLQARESIITAAEQALDAAGLDRGMLGSLLAGVGLAGVNIPRFHSLMAAWDHPFRRMYLTTDIHIACLGAHRGRSGAVLVVGTGSVGYAFAGPATLSLGGHGFPFGDIGSGAWLGLEAMKAALLAMEELGPATTLVTALERQLGACGLDIIDTMAGARSRDYARLAPAVFEVATAGDPVASAIVAQGANYLDALALRLLQTGAQSLSMLGGLAERYTAMMSAEVRAQLVAPEGQPDAGAVRFAMMRHREAISHAAAPVGT